MKRIMIVTEADERVASGHLMECIDLADVLKRHGYTPLIMVNDDIPLALKEKIKEPYDTYSHNIKAVMISEKIRLYKADIVIFNFRSIQDDLLRSLRECYVGKIICIDELGQRHLSCDIIINPMIDPYYWEYENEEATVYSGGQYLSLSRGIGKYHKRDKIIRDTIERICVSMGGVDPFGTTLKLAKWLPEILPGMRIDIVTGGGFKYTDALRAIIHEKENIFLHQNIDYIYDLFFESDIAFCAGGNTLHELACIGTSAIVIPSMPHEVRNGKHFERNGFGICLPITGKVSRYDVGRGVLSCESAESRRSHAVAGKKLVSGNGANNIFKIIQNLSDEKVFQEVDF